MTTNPCLEAACVSAGVFPGRRLSGDDVVTGFWCFTHDPGAPDDMRTDGETPDVVADAGNFHVDVTFGFAAMVLEHAAMTAAETDTANDDAMRSLASNSALSLDLAAGILLAVTAVIGAGELSPERVTDLAAIFEQQANTEDDNTEDLGVPEDDPTLIEFLDEGWGKLPDTEVGPDDERDGMANEVPCQACDGTGWVAHDDEIGREHPCTACDGRGVIDIAGPLDPMLVDVDEMDDDDPLWAQKIEANQAKEQSNE